MTSHLEDLAALLALERAEEEARAAENLAGRSPRQLQADGLALIGLELAESSYSGVEERLEVTLRRSDAQPLSYTQLRVGSRVSLAQHPGDETPPVAGTVLGLSAGELTITLDQDPESDFLHGALRVTQTSDDVTLRRMEEALGAVAGAREGRLKELRRVLVECEKAPEVDPTLGHIDTWCDDGLDASQQVAVSHAMACRHVALVHGPPGTGKTRTVVEIIRQTLALEQTVLATAPSNIAVDNLLERLADAGVRTLRIGHPARTRPHLRCHGFDEQVAAAVDPDVHKRLRSDERNLVAQLRRARTGWRELRAELRNVRGDLKRLHRDARRQVLHDAQVVLATCTGAAGPLLGGRRFDLAVIDEAAQCLEPLAYLPMVRAERLVLAGDHLQLPPTVLSVEAERQGFGRSLFERVIDQANASGAAESEHPARMLTVQYRMHLDLMRFLSAELYDGRLEAHESVAGHRLGELPPLVFIDTAGAGFDEERHGEGSSFHNSGEAGLLVRHVQEQLLDASVPPTDIAVITPYAGQVELLRRELPVDGLEIDTVDGFQGREKEAVVVSLVRSNPEGQIGFLADIRRMNVALSRARKHLWVIGDSATLARHAFYAAFVAHAESVGGYDSAWSFM